MMFKLLFRLYEWVRPTKDERGSARDGAFSTYSEFHAAAIGGAVALYTAATGDWFPAAVLLGLMVGRVSRVRDLDSHLVDVMEEPAYAAGAFVLLFLVGQYLL